MPPIINAQNISKAFGAKPLFENVSFTVSEADRIGPIGPNGSGKSTLFRILAGLEEPDDGDLAVRKRLRLSYVEQESRFIAGASVRSVLERAVELSALPHAGRGAHFAETAGRAGFEDLDVVHAECILSDVFGETLFLSVLDHTGERHNPVRDLNLHI